LSENQKKTTIQVSDPMLLKVGITQIPVTGPDPVNVTTHPVNSEKAHSRNPYSEKKASQ
jgi:hypothetical protein